MLVLVACTALELVIAASASADPGAGLWFHSDRGPSSTQALAPVPVPEAPHPVPEPPAPQPAAPQEPEPGTSLARNPAKVLHIWLTGYSFQDNTPPGSAIVSAPAVHRTAGGTGTYTDPITVAVPGHADERTMAWRSGTLFYLPTVQRYAIVEDSGASPAPSGQDGHLDMWVDGQGDSKTASDRCMDRITGVGIPAIMDPPPDQPVLVGPITSNGSCLIPKNSN
ncbi:hypothetical protein [Pseudonocardia spinosispora]|uniref:hypothetical protein n=1 Tax=Pseudonocardia spinosispora TaxID=103441 RepID=UPI0006868CFD|nr:hypothetical protein [Pseudonocardia spinosispora]